MRSGRRVETNRREDIRQQGKVLLVLFPGRQNQGVKIGEWDSDVFLQSDYQCSYVLKKWNTYRLPSRVRSHCDVASAKCVS
jgi:hypothetical protein